MTYTKKEVMDWFKEAIKVDKEYYENDKPALREAWNNYTDHLCKSGVITLKQYETWTNPF